jgi:Fe-S cluster assembly ATP-binding protein
MSTLAIKDLHVSVETDQGVKQILKGVDLNLEQGSIHAIMGPNGSGKSTLAYTIAGHPKYHVEGGSITLDGVEVLDMSVDERARAGLFLAMQYPVEIPGVTVSNFLRTAKTALDGEAPALRSWVKEIRESMEALRMDRSFAERNVNEGFSGGEKKRHEILQLELLKPKFAVLDETDSGLDVDALKKGEHRPRCSAHHALHPHPPLHPPRLCARIRQRTRRGRGRARAGRTPRKRGLRPLPHGSGVG